MHHALGLGEVGQFPGFGQAVAERPFAVDVFAGVQCGGDQLVVVGPLDGDNDHVDLR